MAQVDVFIEETLCKKVNVWVPDNLTVDERMEYAEKEARKAYKNNQIVLTADDFNGQASIMVRDVESERETSWNNL